MSDTPGVAWLAACSMGLACSPVRSERKVEVLGRAARWDPTLLEEAQRLLANADVGDAVARRGAVGLLRDALDRSRHRPAIVARRRVVVKG